MRKLMLTQWLCCGLFGVISLTAVPPAVAAGPTYGYCFTKPENVFGEELKRRYPRRIVYVSGVIKVLDEQDATVPWGEFYKFIEAKGTSRTFRLECNDRYASVQSAQAAVDAINFTTVGATADGWERTGWTNVTANDVRRTSPIDPPLPPARERGRVYVTLPQPTTSTSAPTSAPERSGLPSASEEAADQARAKASYERQRALQEAEYRRVAEENANRQAAYQAQVAQQQAEYAAMIAAREAQAAKVRAEWEARVARCKGGDKKSCYREAVER